MHRVLDQLSNNDENTCQGCGKEYDNDGDIAKTGWMGVTILDVGDSITIGVQDTLESLYT